MLAKSYRLLRRLNQTVQSRNSARRRQQELDTYLNTGRRPWSPGYHQFRTQYLQDAVNNADLLRTFREAQALPSGYGYRLDARMVELPWVLSHLAEHAGRVLDAGSSLNNEIILTAPAMSNKKITLVTLAPERNAFWKLGVSYVYDDLRDLPFRDNLFDAIACISTIEHVGMDNTRYTGKDSASGQPGKVTDHLKAIEELQRILKPGGTLFISFPFGRYEDHGWFQQFDAAMIDQLVAAFAPAEHQESVYKYEAEGWVLSDRAGCADSTFFDVHMSKYFDLTSTIDFPPHYPAGEGAVACLRLLK